MSSAAGMDSGAMRGVAHSCRPSCLSWIVPPEVSSVSAELDETAKATNIAAQNRVVQEDEALSVSGRSGTFVPVHADIVCCSAHIVRAERLQAIA